MVKKNCSLYVYTDGSSRGNPGNASVAFTIYDDKGKIISEKSKPIGISTNNVAEYKALISALEEASKFCRGELSCFSDSKLVISQINQVYKVKKKHLIELFTELKDIEKMFKKVKYIHRQETDSRIARVDKLAKQKTRW